MGVVQHDRENLLIIDTASSGECWWTSVKCLTVMFDLLKATLTFSVEYISAKNRP